MPKQTEFTAVTELYFDGDELLVNALFRTRAYWNH